MSSSDENYTLDYKAKTFEINRSDSIYQEIESFGTYEYTNCIAYEMAIRNEELKKEIEKYTEKDIRHPNIKTLRDEFSRIANNYFFDLFLYLDDKFNNLRYTHNIFRPFPQKFLVKKNFSVLRDNINHPHLKELKTSKNFVSVSTNSKLSNYKFFILQSRPQLYIPENLRYKIPELNLALPLEELIELVTIYKKEYEKNNKIFKTEIEILGEELEKATHTIKIKDKDINIKEHINTKYKMADLFYIYDALKLKMKKSDICRQITNYYEKNSTFDNKTLNKYFEIATEYIDNLKYKELISDIKISNLKKKI